MRDLFGRSGEELQGPQGFVVEFPPHSRSGAHYHPVDQFQVFFPIEKAWYQRSPLDHVVIHYADAYATYGPFGTGDLPLHLYTLRARATTTTGYMPGAQSEMLWRGRRNLEAELTNDLEATLAAGRTQIDPLFGPDGDGLAAYLVRSGPLGRVRLPTLGPGSPGQYVCVIQGSVMFDRRLYEERSLGWSERSSNLVLEGGPAGGFAAAVLQFPQATSGS